MHKILLTLAAVWCCALSVARADDTAEARKAFDLFVQYSKVADARLLDLFAEDVSVTLAYDSGKETQDAVLPTETFRQIVRESIAAKDGDKDDYEDVKCAQEGDLVKLTCTRVEDGTKAREPFLLVYGKDAAGHLKIKAMKMTVPEPKVPPGN